MNRNEFLIRLFRYILFGLLGLIAIATGSRAIKGLDCAECAGKGICTGTSDCLTYLKK
jgi:hypothetical protein